MIASSELDLEEILLIEEEPVSRPGKLATWPKLAFLEPSGKLLTSFAFPPVKFIHHLATFLHCGPTIQTQKELTTVLQKEKGINFVIHFDKKIHVLEPAYTVCRENQKFSLCRICIFI